MLAVALAVWTFARPRRLEVRGLDACRVVDVSIVIPARDEAATLPALLASIAACGARPREVIVVDDHSTDGTATVAIAGGATVITAPPLPAGWAGKCWACHTGAAAAQARRILFLDADTTLSRGALTALVATHERCGGLLSVAPHHVTVHRYEELSAMFNAVAAMSSGAFSLLSDGSSDLAFGPCLLATADDYHHAGGHAAVQGSVIDDVALAAAFLAAGLPVHCRLGAGAVAYRMYPGGLRTLVEGWTKNIAAGAGSAPATRTLPVVAWVAAMAAVAWSAITGLVGWVAGAEFPAGALAAWAIVAVHLTVVLRSLGTFRRSTSALFAVPLACFVAVFVRSASAVVLRRQVRWKGRSLPARPPHDPLDAGWQ